jgi:two-component system, sensor histidine kinase PdtaS
MNSIHPRRLPLGRGIARKFIVGILLFSSLITLTATGLQLYLDYSYDINSLEQGFDQIETSRRKSIIHSIWVSNQRQLRIQLEGILELPNVQWVAIRESEGSSFSLGIRESNSAISREYPLYYTYRGKRISLGSLHVVASLDGIYSRLWDKALVILVSQTIKTFLVSGFIFFLFYLLIGRHLLTLVGFANKFDPNALPEPIVFDRRKPDPPDELDQVVTSMNQMQSRLSTYLLELTESREQLGQSLQEKVVLLREIHHRVKNNLQIVSSLVSLQSKSISDPEAVSALEESRDRINTMALIHEKLYCTENLQRIDFADYVGSFTRRLLQASKTDPSRVELEIDISGIELDVQTAIPMGMIINELLSNSLKHAFPDDQRGKIHISLVAHGGGFMLDFKDDGIGLPDGLESDSTESLGMRLVHMFTEQLDGNLEHIQGEGTRFRITFSAREG